MHVRNNTTGVRGVALKKGAGKPFVEIQPGQSVEADIDTKHKVVAAWIEDGTLSVMNAAEKKQDDLAKAQQEAQSALNDANEKLNAAESALKQAKNAGEKKEAEAALSNAEEAVAKATADLDALQ